MSPEFYGLGILGILGNWALWGFNIPIFLRRK